MTTHKCAKCPRTMPYEQSYFEAMAALKKLGDTTTKVSVLLAFAIKESSANPYFTKLQPLYTDNMRELTKFGPFKELDYWSLWEVGARGGNVRIPKFEFQAQWANTSQQLSLKYKLTSIQVIALSCSYGLAGQSACFYLAENPALGGWREVLEFMWSPALQWNELAVKAKELLKDSEQDLALAATRYNAGAGANRVTDYGLRVVSIEAGVRGMLEKGGLPICSV